MCESTATDIEYFHDMLATATDPDDIRRIEAQIAMLEDAVVVYKLRRPANCDESRSIRVLVINSEIPGVLVGQGLEHDICVQGKNIEEIVSRISIQLDFYLGRMVTGEPDGSWSCSGCDILATVPTAPIAFFNAWDKKDTVDQITVNY